MLRELRCAFWIVVAIALLFGAGCVSEKDFEEARFECIELSSGAFTDVPACDSPENCFEELGVRVFGFSDERLSFDVRQELYYYKNYVARSWFYFNMAKDRMEKVQGICIDGRGFESLPRLANEINNFLTNAFEEADNANEKGLVILAMEAAELEGEQVSKIREEALFDVQVKIHNNLNSVSGENIGKSYYSRFMEKVREFNELSEKKGFEPLTIKSFGFEDLVFSATEKYPEKIVSVFMKKHFMLPFMADTLGSFASFLSNTSNLANSFESLKRSPAFEFMALYSGLLGENESVLSGFSALLKEDCVSREFVALENKGLEAAAEEKLGNAKERILRIPFDEFAFIDSDLFIGLTAFSGESELSYREFDFESIKEGWNNSSMLVESLEFELRDIRSKQLLERISIGEKTSRLKKLNFELDKLIDSLEFVEKELLTEFIKGCEKEVQRMEPELNNETSLIELKLKTEDEIARFKNAESLSEKIVYCNQVIGLFGRLSEKSLDAEKTKSSAWNEIGGCLDRLDLFLSVLTETNPNLGRTVQQFKEEIDSGLFTKETAETCGLLEDAATRSLRENLKLEEIETDFSVGKKLIKKILFVLGKSPAMESSSIKSLEAEAGELEGFFDGSRLSLEKAIESIQSIRWRCKELKNKSKEEINSLLAGYLSKNFSLKAMPVENVATGKEFKALYLIEFSNPFFSWPEPLDFSFPLTQKFDGLELKSPNIVSVVQKNDKGIVELSSLPEGKTFAEFYSYGLVSFTVKTEIVKISLNKAEIEKTIRFDTKEMVSGVSVLVPFEFGALEYSNVRAFFNGERTGTGIKDNSLVLTLENVSRGSTAVIYLTVFEPVSFKKTVIERKKIDTNQFQEHVSVSIKNNLNYPLKKTGLIVPFESNPEFIESIKLFNQQGAELVVRVIPGGLVMETEGFAPGEEKNWELKYRINDETEYFKEKKKELEKRLGKLSVAPGSAGGEAGRLLEEAAGIGLLEFAENKDKLGRVFDELLVLESKQEKERLMLEEFEFLESELTKKIGLFEKEMEGMNPEHPQVIGFTEVIDDSKKKLLEAGEIKKTNKAKALEIIYGVQAELTGFSVQEHSATIKKQSIEFLEEINSIKKQAESLGVHSAEIELNSQKATELFLKLEEFINKRENGNATVTLSELSELAEKTRKEFEILLESEIKNTASKLNKFIGGTALVKSKIDGLKSEFSSVLEEELISTKTMLPFKKELVEELESEFNSLDLKYSDEFKNILFKITDGEQEEALKAVKKTELSTALAKIVSLEERASSMELSLKSSALAELSSAKERLSELDKEGILKLEEAVSEANKNNYLKSLVLSRAALAAAKPQEFDSTLLLYPVFVVLAVLLVRVLKKKKENPKPALRRIPRRY